MRIGSSSWTGGRINAIGTHRELLKTNQIYQEVYESQRKGGDQDE